MLRVFSKACLLLLLSAGLTGVAQADDDFSAREANQLGRRMVRLARSANPKTVCVLGMAGSGTGAVVSADGTVVTNAHVAALSRYAVLLFSDGRKVLAKRHGIDYGRDLAILKPVKALDRKLPHFKLGEGRPAVGDWVAAVGYPGGPRTTAAPTFSIGVVQAGKGPGAVNGMLNYSDAVTTDAPIFPGNSGGPLVDLQGRLVGINGAVNLAGTAAYSIPINRVKDRLERLNANIVMMPGERVIDLRRNRLMGLLYKLVDPVVKQTMEQRLRPSRSVTGLRAAPKASFQESDELALRARRTPRNKRLGKVYRGALRKAQGSVLKVESDRRVLIAYATVVAPRYALTVADRLKGHRRGFRVDGRPAKVVKVNEAQNLVLLKLPRAYPALALAGNAPVGSLVLVGAHSDDAKKGFAAGAVSVEARSVSGAHAAALSMSGGLPAPVDKAVKRIRRLARLLRNKQVLELLDQVTQSMKLRQAYMRGNAPRGFRSVISHDAPLAPSQVGVPLINGQGRLVGVNVGNAHFGTSYAVGPKALRAMFPELFR